MQIQSLKNGSNIVTQYTRLSAWKVSKISNVSGKKYQKAGADVKQNWKTSDKLPAGVGYCLHLAGAWTTETSRVIACIS